VVSRRLVAFAGLALVGLGCEGADVGAGGGNGGPANACIVTADHPHRSTTAARQGREEIVGKGWFRCARVPKDITLTVRLELELGGGHWNVVGTDGKPFAEPQANRKYEVPTSAPCSPGTFRTAAVISGHNDRGEYQKSAWTYSTEITDPCKRRQG